MTIATVNVVKRRALNPPTAAAIVEKNLFLEFDKHLNTQKEWIPGEINRRSIKSRLSVEPAKVCLKISLKINNIVAKAKDISGTIQKAQLKALSPVKQPMNEFLISLSLGNL